MRIGTWNLQGRWDERHLHLLDRQACDVWLLTEVNTRVQLPGWSETRATASMAAKRTWAGVFARGSLQPLEEPHPATAAARIGEVTFWSSILPWRNAGAKPPWVGDRHADWTRANIDALLAAAPAGPLVWGGDWNHAVSGLEHAGSIDGREAILGAVSALGLQVLTGQLEHRLPGLLSIDHIAVPAAWRASSACRVVAESDGTRLSDHDLTWSVAPRTPKLPGTARRLGRQRDQQGGA